MPTVFLSHKTEHAAVDQALADAKCFVLLYTDVRLDWSWCFFEAGSFAALPPGKPLRPIYCLHPPDVPPPSPLANLQAVRATPEDLEEWVRNALCPAVGCQRQPSTGELTAAIKQIETLIKGTSLVKERVLKPSIWIDPPWPGPGDQPNWNDVTAIANVDFASGHVVPVRLVAWSRPRRVDPERWLEHPLHDEARALDQRLDLLDGGRQLPRARLSLASHGRAEGISDQFLQVLWCGTDGLQVCERARRRDIGWVQAIDRTPRLPRRQSGERPRFEEAPRPVQPDICIQEHEALGVSQGLVDVCPPVVAFSDLLREKDLVSRQYDPQRGGQGLGSSRMLCLVAQKYRRHPAPRVPI